MTLLPVEMVTQGEDRWHSLGWHAMPVVPAVGEYVRSDALVSGRIVSVTWEHRDVGDTMSMRNAGLWRGRGFGQWVAKVVLDDSSRPPRTDVTPPQ